MTFQNKNNPRKKTLLPLILTIILSQATVISCLHRPEKNRNMKTDNLQLFLAENIETGTPEKANGIIVNSDGLITGLWNKGDHTKNMQIHNLQDGYLVPGIHDAHIHIEGIGKQMQIADLKGADSISEVNHRLVDFSKTHPELTVLYGRGWDQNLFKNAQFPKSHDISEEFDIPVVLTRVDGHAVWINDIALNLISKELSSQKTLEGGEIHRNSNGNATGILIDNAIELLHPYLPKTSLGEHQERLRLGLQACADAGLTSVHDMGMSVESFTLLRDLEKRGQLPLRVFVYLYYDNDNPPSDEIWQTSPSDKISLMGRKLYADGALGSRGAALKEDYSDRHGHKGALIQTKETLKKSIQKMIILKKQVAIHCIGDRGVSTVLDAFEELQLNNPDISKQRHRLEHAQVVDKNDFQRIKQLGLIASMQPTHATSDMPWAEKRLGRTRILGAYAWKDMLKMQIPLAFGSDAPVESEDPRLGIYSSLSRQDQNGQPTKGFTPEQRLTLKETLAAFSIGASYAVFEEKVLGQFKIGQRFDATLFSTKPKTDKEWLTVKASNQFISAVPLHAIPPSADKVAYGE